MTVRDPFDLAGVVIDGKYRVASVVGDGGFGVVYRGVHKGFGELIAIKCLKIGETLTEDEQKQLLERLQDEGRLLHRLSKATSGIVQALDVGAFTTPSGQWVPYLVLEWLEGETLADILKARRDSGDGGFGIVEAMRLLDPAARALAVAHGQKIAHRDVKPANIFVSDVGGKRTTKVLDFGIAKVLAEHNTFTTALESTKQAPTAFTPRYGAPEQFNKQRGASGPWTDVFALALVFVECATGRKALEGDDPTQLYIAAADKGMRPTLRARGLEVSEEVEAVIRRALDVEPRERFADAGAFWEALEIATGVDGADLARDSPPVPRKLPPALAIEDTNTSAGLDGSRMRSDPALARGAAAKTAFSPTVPVESLAQNPKRPSSRPDDSDPMAETPPHERLRAARLEGPASRSAVGVEPGPRSRRGAGTIVGAVVAIGLFVGGLGFAYATFFVDPPKPTTPTTKPTTSVKPVTPTVKPRVTSTPSAVVSAIVSSNPSATPTTSASAAPIVVPPDMALVKGGSFKMSGADVTVEHDFLIDRTEVTVAAYMECVAQRKCAAQDRVIGISDTSYADLWTPKCNARRNAGNHPMNCVSYDAAVAYCAWKEKRLPTEPEWFLAASGGTERPYVWGDADPRCASACYGRNTSCVDLSTGTLTCEVGKFASDRTATQIFDLAANVSEWTTDAFGADGQHVVRGGSFVDETNSLSLGYRRGFAASVADVAVGFRCAAAPPGG